MKKGQIVEGYITKVDFPNKAVMQVEGEEKKVLVKGGICGQKIRASINKVRKDKCEGRLLEVLERAETETEKAECPHFGICGGCSLQTLSYEGQLNRKEAQVRALLDEVCSSYQFEGIKGSPSQWGYRNKMEFSFGDEYKDGPLALGMHKKGSFYDLVTVNQCKIADEDYNQILSCVLEHFTELGIPYYRKIQHTGILRHLLVRKAVKTGEILIALVTASSDTLDTAGLTEENKQMLHERLQISVLTDKLLALALKGRIKGILHIINDTLADVVQSDETLVLYGQDFFYEELLGLKFKISPFSFFQTNSLGAEVLYETARSYVGETKDKVIFDLYSGTGTIAQMLAPVAKKVIGVEIVEEAVRAAQENAALNGLSNCEFIAGDVLKVIDEVTDKPDLIVLDPPRDGIHPKALGKIIDFGVDRIVYISCKPTSLARDLVGLQERGYRVERVCCVDMFPNTDGIETVVLLSQQKPDDRIEVEIELDELDLTSAESKATYKEIQEYVLEKYGLKVSNLYISQVKRKCGIEVGENYNLPKSEDSRQPQCPEEKEKAIRDALEHFGMV